MSVKFKPFWRRWFSKAHLSIHSLNKEVFMAETNMILRTINNKGFNVWHMVVEAPSLDGSNILLLPTDWVNITYDHYESPREKLLILILLILACKVHILVCFIVFKSFPFHAGDWWVLKGITWKWRVATFIQS